MKRIEIAPGAFVQSVPGEKFKRCKIVFHFIAPSDRATATHLALLPSVLERRCEAIPDATELARHLFNLYGAELGTDSYTLGSNRVLSLAVSGLKNGYALAGEDLAAEYLNLACNLLFAPKVSGGAFGSEDVAIEKDKQIDFLKSEMNDKRSYCLRQARRKLYGDSVAGIESGGYLEDVPGITPQNLYDVYIDFIRRAQLEVVVCGLDAEAAGAAIAKRLEALDRAPEPMAENLAVRPEEGFEHFAEPMDTAQGKLCILLPSGKRLDAAGEAVMRVANAVFGGLPTSRLFTNVREKKSLCYYCASSYGSFSSVLSVDSGIDHQNAQLASGAILEELEALQKQPVTDWELAAAHRALKNAFSTAKDSPEALANWVFLERMRGSNLSFDEVSELVSRVTADQVQQAMQSFTPRIEYIITGKEGA